MPAGPPPGDVASPRRRAAFRADALAPRRRVAFRGDALVPRRGVAFRGDASFPRRRAAFRGDAVLPRRRVAFRGDVLRRSGSEPPMLALGFEWLTFAIPNPLGVAFAVVGGYYARRGLRKRADRDRVAAVDTTPIRRLRSGRVQIEGTAKVLEETVPRPFAPEEDALVAEVEVEDAGESGRSGARWDAIHRERDVVPFVVDDGTGTAVVEPPEDGEFVLGEVRHKTGLLRGTPDAVREYVERTPELDRNVADYGVAEFQSSERRYTERTLRPGEDVYVLGEAEPEDDLWSAEHRHTVSGDPETFVLGDRGEGGVVDELESEARKWLLVGGFLLLLGLYIVVHSWPGTPI